MFGDQGFFERGHNVSFSRSRESDLVERLDGLVSIPQEWHKKRVSFFIRTSKTGLPAQLKPGLGPQFARPDQGSPFFRVF